MRTIIDLLKQGNQELFHSAIISWLLNPKGEHGCDAQFLLAFADVVAERGRPELKSLIQTHSPSFVTREKAAYKGRYDIAMKFGDTLFVIENKTKSVGAAPQIEQYTREGALPIALGLSDASFSEEVRMKYPLVTYKDVLSILEHMPALDDPFGALIEHYRLFLRRELKVLDLIKECFEDGLIERDVELAALLAQGESAGYYTINDIRFLNLHYIERLKRCFGADSRLTGAIWESEKNMRSGVWLSNYKAPPSQYHFLPPIEALREEQKAGLWFHLELWQGVGAKVADEVAGALQLKCWIPKERDKRQFVTAFLGVHTPAGHERAPARIENRYETFSLISKNLTKRQLVFSEMTGMLIEFMSRFGRLAGSAG